jgi:hypothetical protein
LQQAQDQGRLDAVLERARDDRRTAHGARIPLSRALLSFSPATPSSKLLPRALLQTIHLQMSLAVICKSFQIVDGVTAVTV